MPFYFSLKPGRLEQNPRLAHWLQSCTSLHGFLTGVERLVELAVKKMFMKESIILSLADADDFAIDFEHVLALANSFDFNFWFHRSPPLSSQMPRISEKWADGSQYELFG